jgi:hypothetical protein
MLHLYFLMAMPPLFMNYGKPESASDSLYSPIAFKSRSAIAPGFHLPLVRS